MTLSQAQGLVKAPTTVIDASGDIVGLRRKMRSQDARPLPAGNEEAEAVEGSLSFIVCRSQVQAEGDVGGRSPPDLPRRRPAEPPNADVPVRAAEGNAYR